MSDPIRVYKAKLSKIKSRYGVGINVIHDLLDTQKGCCAICHVDFGSTLYHIDHNHDTLVIRGLLCSNCNTGIGLLKEDEGIINSALKYINKEYTND